MVADEAGKGYRLAVRKLYPFIGLAIAVAVGVALAPYAWWLLALGALTYGVVALSPRARGILLWLAVASIFLAWAAWLQWRGQTADAVFVLGLLALAIGWQWLRRQARTIRDRYMRTTT